MIPHVEGDDPTVRADLARFVDSTGADYSLWDGAHNATALTRREFAAWATENVAPTGWCEVLFGPDQHQDRFDHERHEWRPRNRVPR